MATLPSNSSTLLRSPQNWKEALDRYCREHVCLQATLSELVVVSTTTLNIDHCHADDDDDDDVEIPWVLPTPFEIVTPADHDKLNVASSLEITPTTDTTTSLSSSLFHAAKSLVGTIYSTVKHYTTDEDEYWHEPEPGNGSMVSSSTASVPLDQAIVHVDLTRECLSTLLEYASLPLSSLSSSSPVLVYRRPPWTFVPKSDWVQWVRMATTHHFPPSSSSSLSPPALSVQDCTLLLNVLIANHHVYSLCRHDDHAPDVIVMPTGGTNLPPTKPNDDTTTTTIPAPLQVPLALFDLHYSIKQLEARLEHWANEVDICSQKALHYKRQSQTKLALGQIARRRLLQEQMDTHSSTLLQLERVYTSIDTAQSNQAMLGLLSEGSRLLHQLSSQTSVVEIDNLQDRMQDLMDDVAVAHTVLTSHTTAGTEVSDDDLLLAELAALTIAKDDEEEVEDERSNHQAVVVQATTGRLPCPSEGTITSSDLQAVATAHSNTPTTRAPTAAV
jgi:Snf7